MAFWLFQSPPHHVDLHYCCLLVYLAYLNSWKNTTKNQNWKTIKNYKSLTQHTCTEKKSTECIQVSFNYAVMIASLVRNKVVVLAQKKARDLKQNHTQNSPSNDFFLSTCDILFYICIYNCNYMPLCFFKRHHITSHTYLGSLNANFTTNDDDDYDEDSNDKFSLLFYFIFFHFQVSMLKMLIVNEIIIFLWYQFKQWVMQLCLKVCFPSVIHSSTFLRIECVNVMVIS